MKVSTKGRYGLRLMIDLVANAGKHERVSLHHVAERQNISEKYLWQIAARLKAAGLIIASAGANGGYTLAKDPSEITLADILEAMEGKMNLVPCARAAFACPRSTVCISREVWKMLSAKMTEILKSITLSDIMQGQMVEAPGTPFTYAI